MISRAILVLLFLVANAYGRGVAVKKSQKFHSDASAKPFVFSSVSVTPSNLKFIVGRQTFTYPQNTLIWYIEIPEAIPHNLTNDQELAPVREALDDVEAFAKKFSLTKKLLQPTVNVLQDAVDRYERGERKFEGNWRSKEAFAKIQKERIQLATWAKQHWEARARREQKKAEFAASQRKKGLVDYKGRWIPDDEARALQKKDAISDLALKQLRDKSISAATFKIFQILDEGALVNVTRGKSKNGGINLSLVYIDGIEGALVADGDYYKDDLFYCGSYSYETVAGSSLTVNAYRLDKGSALALLTRRLSGGHRNGGGNKSIVADKKPKDIHPALQGAKATGSGFFVGDSGYFVTNFHVIDGFDDVSIYFRGKLLPAEIVTSSRVSDLAILKIGMKVTGLRLASADAKPGQDVFALGFPLPELQGVEIKVTKGIISSSTGMDQDNTRYQIDAAIQPGNSGGPVCNDKGIVVGVATAKLNDLLVAKQHGSIPQNVNYAVKSTEILALLRTRGIKLANTPTAATSKMDAAARTQNSSRAVALVVMK